MDKSKFVLPITILVASIILGGFSYASQVNKQNSIERQQAAKLQEDRRQQEIKNSIDELKLKQDECSTLSTGVMKKWNNVMGVTYDSELWEECVVTYTDPESGEIETSPLKFMQDNR